MNIGSGCGLRSLSWNWFLAAYVALIALLLFVAPAHASTDPVKDTRQIMAGTVTTAKIKNEYLSGARDGTAAFKGALAAYKVVRAAEVPPPPPQPAWIPAPLADASGYARATTACRGFGGGQRAASSGEVFRMIIAATPPRTDPSAWGWSAGSPGEATLSVSPLDGSAPLILPLACLEGVKPAG